MAKGKKKRTRTEAVRQPEPREEIPEQANRDASWLEYAIHLAVFIAFCLVSGLLIRFVTGYSLGLKFFFGVLILGFFVVCIFSFLHDRFYRDDDQVETGP